MAGLGNPEPRYSGTRHNAGQMVVDELASRLGATRFTGRYGGRLAAARGPSGPVGLLVPLTYMNESGHSVGPAAGALHAPPEQVAGRPRRDRPPVRDRAREDRGRGRGAQRAAVGDAGAGHGRVPAAAPGRGKADREFRGDGADWVLTRFSEPREEVEAMIARAADMAEAVLAEGMDAAMNRFHAKAAE